MSPNGLFEVVVANGVGLADAVADDLAILTTEPSQRIRIGCGEGSVSTLVVAADGVTFNAPLTMSRLAVSNLDVSDAIVALSMISSTPTPKEMTLKNYNGALALSATQRCLINVASPSQARGAFQVVVSDRERLRVAANGFVGIGTQCPASALDVVGAVSVSGVSVVSSTRGVFASTLDVDGATSLGSGMLTLDPLARYVSVSSNVAVAVAGRLAVAGEATLSGGAAVSGGDFRANSLLVEEASGFVGVGTLAPRHELDVVGTVCASVGSLGPTFVVVPPLGYTDIAHGDYLVMDASTEPGNPGDVGSPFFGGGSLLGGDASGEDASWTSLRFVVRGVLMSPQLASNPFSRLAVHRYNADSGVYSAATSLVDLPNAGMANGYRFFVTPWVAYEPGDSHYALYHRALDEVAKFRVCSVHVQFSSAV